MLASAALLLALECLAPGGPTLARVRLTDGTEVTARDGALQIGARTVTFCDGLPDAHPTAVAEWDGRLVVGFRFAGVQFAESGTPRRFVPIPGLPRRATLALAVTGKTLWVGTSEGLWSVTPAGAVRDPHAVLSRRPITALHTATDGSLQIGAGAWGWWERQRGVTHRVRAEYAGCFVERRGRVEAVPPGPGCQGPPATAAAIPTGHVTALAQIDDRLFVATFDRGLWWVDGDGQAHPVVGVPPFVNALLADGARLWVGTTTGLFHVDGERASRLPLGLVGEHVNGLASGATGSEPSVWVATSEGLVQLCPGGARILDEQSGLPSRLVYAVAQSTDGAVWAATSAGIVRWADGAARLYSQASGALSHDWVTALLADGEGVIAGTYDAGVLRLAADGTSSRLPGLEHVWVNPSGLARRGGRLWVMTLGDGLIAADPDGVTRFHLPDEDVTALAPAGDHLWIGTRGGLVRSRL